MDSVISISALAFDGYAFEQTCATIAEAGGSHVEPAFVASYGAVDEAVFTSAEARNMARIVAEAGLQCTTLSAHVDSGRDDATERLIRRLNFAAELGVHYLISNAGAAGSERCFIENMTTVAAHAETLGIIVCLENPGDSGSLFTTAADACAWMGRFKHPFIGVNYDCGNVFTATNGRVEPIRDISEALPASTHLHLKDFQRTGGELRPCAIGSGILRYESILQIVRAHGAIPPLSLEMPLRMIRSEMDGVRKGPVLPLDDITTAVRSALSFVRKALGMSLIS